VKYVIVIALLSLSACQTATTPKSTSLGQCSLYHEPEAGSCSVVCGVRKVIMIPQCDPNAFATFDPTRIEREPVPDDPAPNPVSELLTKGGNVR